MKKLLLSFCVVLTTLPFISSGAITVITPNGGENWIMGCPYLIQWVTTNPTAVKIDLYKVTSANLTFCMTICNMVPANMNNFTWSPPTTLQPGNIYRVKISSLSNTAGFDFSDNNFAINTGSITVISPNGGEIWYKGSTHQILWTDNICSDVRIELWKGGVFHSVIAAFTPSSGSFTWAIPNVNTLIPGSDYKVKIMRFINSNSASILFDFSDNNFSIMGITNAVTVMTGKPVIIFPNPCNDILHLKFRDDPGTSVSVEIYDMKGSLVLQHLVRDAGKHETIDLNTAAIISGRYLLMTRKGQEILSRDNLIILH